jgi:RNA polymerase sigma-70 factor (ECF subfamily)
MSVVSGDTAGVAALLREDAISISDGGGKAKAARNAVVGRDRVAALSLGLAKRAAWDVETFFTTVNGQHAMVAHAGPRLITVVVFAVEDGLIASMFTLLNPEKLERLGRELLPARLLKH